jgi:predicted transposase YbfD/YdcC
LKNKILEINNSLGALLENLSEVPDPRKAYKTSYPLPEILFLTISAVVSDCTTWQEVADFGNDKLVWLRKYLPYADGIPSHDTLNRVFSLIDKEAFEVMFAQWVQTGLKLAPGTLINIDGKKLRSSATKQEQQTSRSDGGKGAIHLVEAWCSDLSLCLSVREVDQKTNEIVAIPLILNDLDIEGCVVSIDAIGCQKNIAEQIRSKNADYLLGLKLNQESLLVATQAAFESFDQGYTDHTLHKSTGVDHGRIEERICRVLNATLLPEWIKISDWKDLNSIIEIQSERTIMATGTVMREKRYYISSLQIPASQIGAYVRGHWNIENQLHWSLDVSFGEDYSTKQVQNAAANFGTVLRIALNLVKTSSDNASINRKLKKCSRDDDYREKTLRI